jgi:DNA replication ATP-dependent helicase Dna2
MYGILYYMETSDTYRIRGIRHEIRHMIMQRNELACYVRNRLELPPMIKKPYLCGRCYAKTACFVYHKLGENGDGETSGMAEKFDEVVSHLTPRHQEFFKKWDDLLTKEEKDMFRFRRELWTMLSTEREALGRCFANLVIEPGSAYESEEGPKINRFRYTFNKQKDSPGFSFGESQIAVGEPIVISDEKGHFALANGYVTHVRRKRITVAVDRKLHNARVQRSDFDAQKNQSFTGMMEIVDDGDRISTMTPQEPTEQKLYRLDRDEFSNGMATARNNIIRMMEKDLYRARELRDLIIDGKAPEFRKIAAKYTLSGPASQADINVDQHRAIEKVMNAKDYALVLGMPGTGKTTTIAHIIHALVSKGKSVLLTSYTHTAVDNILLKIRDDKIKILRLGAIAKIHPEVKQFADLASIPKKSLEELQVSYEQSSVVATTCLGVNHSLFNQRLFDYCIVDEASQITLPVCVGPIRMAKTFILVGDHYQLPPLVQNKEAAEGGLDISLFKLLSDSQPSSVVYLEHQYRMSADIMLLSNTLIYSGRLKCGTEAVATRTLTIPNIAALQSHHYSPSTLLSASSPKKTPSYFCSGPNSSHCWLSRLISPRQNVLFASTDALLPASLDTVQGARIVNVVEAILVSQFVEILITCGVPARDIGVITFYRSQLSLLKQHLRHRLPNLEIHTADKFQGRDKEVVVLSCVRSNEAHNVGDLLRDWRRVNVACTRARSKLVVFGSKGTLGGSGVGVLEGFVDIVDKKGWVVDLPKDAAEGHVFEEGFSQLSGRGTGRWGESPEKRKASVGWDSPEKKKSPRKGASPLKGRSLGRSPGKENGGGVGKMKKPEKMGKGMDVERLLGAGKRPVLQDVVNEIIG